MPPYLQAAPATLVASSLVLCQQIAAAGLYLNLGAKIESNLKFNPPAAMFSQAWATNLSLGSYSYISFHSHLTNGSIGRYSSIAHDVKTLGKLTQHDLSCATTSLAMTQKSLFAPFSGSIPRSTQLERDCDQRASSFKIGNDVWIGAHVKIVGDVTISDGAIIGTHSVITQDVPPYAIVAGSDSGKNSKAIIKRYRFTEEQIADLLELQWWRYDIPRYMAAGNHVPLDKIADFISFMRDVGTAVLPPLPDNWYQLTPQSGNGAQIKPVPRD